MTVQVTSNLSPEGEFQVGLLVDHGSRWLKAKPVYLSRQKARQIAGELLKASGHDLRGVLDDEAMRLRQQLAADDLTWAKRDHLEAAQALVGLLRKLLVPEEVS